MCQLNDEPKSNIFSCFSELGHKNTDHAVTIRTIK